jgi:hypothetical protein
MRAYTAPNPEEQQEIVTERITPIVSIDTIDWTPLTKYAYSGLQIHRIAELGPLLYSGPFVGKMTAAAVVS